MTELLDAVGLARHAAQRPYELSGGQQQRVAIPRALANHPELLVADEPTGQLDSATGKAVMALLLQLVHEQGLAAVVATHDPSLVGLADEVLDLRDGAVAAVLPGGYAVSLRASRWASVRHARIGPGEAPDCSTPGRRDTRRHTRSGRCPSPPPRSTPRCSTGRRPERSPTRPSTCTSSQTLNAALRGFAEAEQRRHHPGLHRRRRVPLRRQCVKDMVDRRGRPRRVRARGRREVPGQHRAAHRPLPARTSSTATCGRCSRSRSERVGPGEQPAVPVAHVGRLGGAARREPGDRRASCSSSARGRQDHPRDRDRRRRRRGGRRRRRDQREALHDPGRRACARSRRSASARRAATCWRDLRQRARRLQAGQRQAPPRDPQGDPGRGRRRSSASDRSRSTSSSTAAPARRSRRSARRSTTAS